MNRKFILPTGFRVVPPPTEAELAALDNNDDEQERDCQSCSGTGEGQFDGQSCGACRGKGY
jgi:hypothetical protein